jgi:hypothetical protein
MIRRGRLAIMAALIALPVMACAESFRQYIEAEDCALETFGPGQNPLGGYNGGRFVYRIDAEPWTGFIRAPLATTVPPGKLRVFVRGYCSDGEPETRTMTVRIGGAEAALKYPREQLDYKHNWIPFELQTAEPAEDVELQVNCAGGRVIIDTIFVTNDPADGTEFANRRTRLVPRHQPPAEQTARPEIEGNMLINSSFEVAPTNGWRAGYQSQWALTDESLSEESPFEGDRCLRPGMLRDKRGALTGRWFTYDGIYSSPFQLEAGAIYTASVYVRTDGPIRGAIGVKGKTESFELEGSDDWQRVSATVEAPNETDSFYVTFTADGPRELFLDAAQLQRGELTDYVPRPGVDVGLSSDQRAGRVWRQGEDMTLAWEVRGVTENAGARVTSIVHDALGRVIHREARQMAAPVGRTATVSLPNGPFPTGAYRVAYTVEVEGLPSYSGQLCYSVIPATRGASAETVGLYASHSEQCFAAMANSGMVWTNTLSSAGHFAEWSYVEPEDDVFVFHDDDIDLARKYGINICANINTNRSNMPKWVIHDQPGEGERIKHPMGWFSLAEWEEFCGALAEHYGGYVKHWLIIDEPQGGTNRYSPEDYAKLLVAANRAIKRADPEAVVFAHAGAGHIEWMETVLANSGPEHFDAIYCYIGRFNQETGEGLRTLSQQLDAPLWTVDFAPVEKLATHFANIDPTRAAPWAETAANTRKYDIWAIRSLSWGRAEKWMRYDARYPGPPPGASYMSIWEHDGSLTPHGVSIATINALIGDAKPLGPVPMPEGMEGHVWSDGARSLLIAWTEDGSSRHLDLPDARAWDVYGGELDAPIVSYLPTFVKFTGEPPEFVAEIAERVTTELLEPEAEGEPYRARFVAEVTGPAQGEWAAAGPYFLQRETTQIIPVEIVEGERAEIVLPLNVWPNLPVKDRLVEVNLYLPGRMLSGALAIDTTDQ